MLFDEQLRLQLKLLELELKLFLLELFELDEEQGLRKECDMEQMLELEDMNILEDADELLLLLLNRLEHPELEEQHIWKIGEERLQDELEEYDLSEELQLEEQLD